MHINNIKFVLKFILSILIVWGCVACAIQTEPDQLDVLRISVQPQQDTRQIEDLYRPLMKYLAQELSIKIQLVKVGGYKEQLDKFHKGEVDLALFGGYAFVKASEQDNADPLVMRDIDFHFTSYFIVNNDNKASNISELEGNRFSFGSELSTSGHIMPRFFLSTQGIVPEFFFSQVLYSGAHHKTAQWVQDKKVDVGVVNSVVMDYLFKNAVISKKRVKVLWETPSYPDYVWAARKTLPESLKIRIIEAFIKLSQENKKDRKLLEQMGAHHYFPANSDDFEPIRRIAYQLKMLSR